MKIKCNPHDDLPLKKTLFFMKVEIINAIF